jgi:hypothetical protein
VQRLLNVKKATPPLLLVSFDARYQKLMFVFKTDLTLDYHSKYEVCRVTISIHFSYLFCVTSPHEL